MTFQPRCSRTLFTVLSRRTFRLIFRNQYARFVFGIRHLWGWPCQKHPSTNTATRALGKTKSGFPYSSKFLRHPVMWFSRRTARNASSVDLLPADLTWRMIHERFSLLTLSISSPKAIQMLNLTGPAGSGYVGNLRRQSSLPPAPYCCLEFSLPSRSISRKSIIHYAEARRDLILRSARRNQTEKTVLQECARASGWVVCSILRIALLFKHTPAGA